MKIVYGERLRDFAVNISRHIEKICKLGCVTNVDQLRSRGQYLSNQSENIVTNTAKSIQLRILIDISISQTGRPDFC